MIARRGGRLRRVDSVSRRERKRAARAHASRSILLGGLLALAGSRGAAAQDFALPRATPLECATALLEDALPNSAPAIAVSAGSIGWYGAPELVTRALVASAGRGAWRAACGVSQSGDAELGWTTLGLGLGAAEPGWGAGARVLARRDRLSGFGARVAPGEGGIEAGAGAWLGLGGDCALWASAPSLVVTGAAPPLARALETGVRWRAPGLTLWLAHRSAPAGYGAACVVSGAAAEIGRSRVWLEAHDAPLAGTLGVSVARTPLEVSASVESHPWLPPLTRLAVSLIRAAP